MDNVMHHCTFKVMIYFVKWSLQMLLTPRLAVYEAHDIENMTGNFISALV